ncbi:uncharacterized protein N7479_010307 [Penicillium vulpinum]|uniref:Uncharacterized protein n=1 Tax=Penicillium vulpinum TaxID=29845 RepID=A0A1V6S8K0_9EURO|nr:uncharacterized protein N7479_010307 [Penicillium vulpinum]KAJ5951894.1 hypothetical protein N7479_010307 [Penicillium vulpinum]OQE10188.1 hypothetical protein PENVUL_c004G06673 [Penicillium vulpinum]
MSLQAAAGNQPCHQATTVRLLVNSLYESTRGSTALTNQAQTELRLLLPLLSTTETYTSALGPEYTHLAILKKILQNCYAVLRELQELLLHPDALGAQSLISDIRARLSSIIYELSDMNCNMMISSQKSIEHALRCFVDEIRAGKRGTSVVSDVLKDLSNLQRDEAWARLQGELVATGIASDLLTLNHGLVISTLRKIITTGGPLPVDKENTAPVEEVPVPMAAAPALKLEPQRSWDDKDWLADEPTDIPFLPLPPKGFSFSYKGSSYPMPQQPYAEKEAIQNEDFPIPVMLDMHDSTDTQKQALPVGNFLIPVLTETDPEVNNMNYPIPVLTDRTRQNNDMNLPIPVKAPMGRRPFNASADIRPFKVPTHSKRPNRMSRMLGGITSSKDALIAAIKFGQSQAVQTLLSKGAGVNTQNADDQTPLMAAVSLNHEAITRLLIEYGADINVQAIKGETALVIAAAHGYDRIVRILIASGANLEAGHRNGKTALSQAAAYGEDQIVELLLNCGANIDAVNITGDTALALAASHGNMRVARLLVDRGAAIDHMQYPWQTPLYKAVVADEVEMVRLLIERGADPFVKGGIGRTETVYALATNTNRGRILEIFTENGYYAGGRGRYQFF